MLYGKKIKRKYGIYNKCHKKSFMNVELEKIEKWRNGETGVPLIDSLMREMNATGFMSNRGRLIVASYFTNDL